VILTGVDKSVDEPSLLEVWKRACDVLRADLAESEYSALIGSASAFGDDGGLVLEAPDLLTMERLSQRLLYRITQLVEKVAGRAIPVRLRSRSAAQQQELFPGATPTRAPAKSRTRDVSRNDGLLERYTFDHFVIGASNQFAHAACLAVANQPGERYNPLFIYGGVGLGKTHLVNAIGHKVIERDSDKRIAYLSAESFMNELISAIRRDRMDDFKSRFRRVDVLILDDVQFLAGRERTQEEFFHTFNSLYESHRQIILTSDKFPKEIPELEERLRNRFEWGLIADIQSPDLETRVAILEKKAETENIDLPNDVALFLAHHVDSNVRELEGSLTRLGAFASLNHVPLTVEFAREVLRSVLRDTRSTITIEAIQKTVCDFFDLRAADLRSKKRTRNIALPRQLAMYLCRRYTQASYPAIGERFGNRDHSTVIHATNTIERRLAEDATFRATVERIEKLLHTLG